MLLSFSHQLCISVGCPLLESALGYIEKSESSVLDPSLVDLLLLIHTQLTWTHVDQEKETAAARDVKKKIEMTRGGWRVHTQLTESGKSHTWRSPCAGGGGAAESIVSQEKSLIVQG